MIRINIKFKVYPAGNGESILIECNGDKQTNILIDCGYVSTYKHIKKDLLELKKRNKELDLLILTHTDNDHINGARKLFEDYIKDEICEIEEIWYNNYFSICDIEHNNDENECEIEISNILENKEYPFDPYDVGEREVSYNSASVIEDYLQIDRLKSKLNKSFNSAIYINNEHEERNISINDDITITLIGPTKKILSDLLDDWNNYLKDNGINSGVIKSKEFSKGFELYNVNKNELEDEIEVENEVCSRKNKLKDYLMFDRCDEKIVNRSSIAFILEFCNKKLLFLGDSSPKDYEVVLSGIAKKNKLKFEAVKVPHHGSKYNMSNNFFNIATSKRYIVSTDGRVFNHPDLETIAKIIINQKEKKDIYFNYKNTKIDEFFDNYNLANSKYNVKYGNENAMTENAHYFVIGGE